MNNKQDNGGEIWERRSNLYIMKTIVRAKEIRPEKPENIPIYHGNSDEKS